ncbi:MAG: metal-dependent hydrolase [Gemmatimonadetes bacterium]|nr:metal-dependent hydrolase [Gemmatimonadota bacterium]
MTSPLGVSLTWLGHSAFHLDIWGGPSLLFDPWLSNPKAPANAAELAATANVICVTHGHGDHIGETVALAKATGAKVLCSVELGMELVAEGAPEEQVVAFNIGGSYATHGVTATLVQAFHSSSLATTDGRPREIGTPCGFVLECPHDLVIYNTGDTGVFGDMALVGEMYNPDILMLPIGDFYTMGPRQAAKACELVQPTWIVPQHYATFPGLPGTPEELKRHLPVGLQGRVLTPAPGETIR